MEANTCKIVQRLAGLKVRGGRVISNNKDNSQSKRLIDLSVASWNVNGFYLSQSSKLSYELRQNVIDCLNSDLISM